MTTEGKTSIGFREFLHSISPAFLSRGLDDARPSARYMHTMGVVIDAVAERARLALLARFPSSAPEDAIPAIGADRKIIRGFEEPLDLYRERLRIFLDTWRSAGSPWVLLDQLAAGLTGHSVRMRLVDDKGNWWTREADGTRVRQTAEHNWNWDNRSVDHGGSLWSRGWLIIYPPEELWVAGPKWGEATWSSERTWGSTATQSQITTIRRIVQRFKPIHAWCLWIIIAFDPDSFDPSAPEPDGTWRYWSITESGVRRKARLTTARYAMGSRQITGSE